MPGPVLTAVDPSVAIFLATANATSTSGVQIVTSSPEPISTQCQAGRSAASASSPVGS